ncbi:hypothetical protein GXP67_14470 [Rhodocytophaga rosea]|uniref:Lipoprotein n=1 Tax=Rhodocytophaga rosea TaxID=2704465 RepID=A0A6C0GI66_9BACT|nr:hypothetical protein [Rhodocytophaga rosea]QHT67751.1 hypothetical protein GXP67_14470 [Rhodocytophaga rosea]
MCILNRSFNNTWVCIICFACIGIACNPTINTFSWKKATFRNNTTGNELQIASTITHDKKTLTVLFDTTVILQYAAATIIDTTLSYTLTVPFTKPAQEKDSIANVLEYFVSKDSLTTVQLQIAVNNQLLNVPIPEIDTTAGTLHYGFPLTLTQEQVNASDSFIAYTFTVNITKPVTESDMLFQLEGLDLIAKKEE